MPKTIKHESVIFSLLDCSHFTVYIHTSVPPDVFPLTKLLPNKSNVRRTARPRLFGEEEEEEKRDLEGLLITERENEREREREHYSGVIFMG